MKKISLLYTSFLVILALFALHLLGTYFYFYWSLDWYDSVVHFLGGLSMGMLTIWLWWDSGAFDKKIPTKKEAMLTALIFVMMIGVGWEFFELVNGLTQSTEGYALDTFHDVVSDFLGGVLAGFWGSKKSFYVS